MLRHNDVVETGLKRGSQPNMGPNRYLLPPTTYLKLNCTVQARRGGGIRNNSGRGFRNGNVKMNSADLCNRAPIITALGMGARPNAAEAERF